MKNKKIIITVFSFVFILILIIGISFNLNSSTNSNNQTNESTESIESNTYSLEAQNVKKKIVNGMEYYIITGDYKGEYQYQEINLSKYYDDYNTAKEKIKLFNRSEIVNFDTYKEFCETWELEQKYTDSNQNYMIISYASYGRPIVKARLADALVKDNTLNVYLWDTTDGDSADISGYFMVIPVDKGIVEYKMENLYTEEEINNQYIIDATVKKPIIYIYPKKKINVNVKLSKKDALTTSYPKYNDGWNVTATPNGNLYDKKTNKNYYGLYYESKKKKLSMKEDGFIVKGKDVVRFLEDKLTILGLNDKERNEFIIYWLPILEANKYNYIRFETDKEINDYMKLQIDPKPDTMIRIIMDYKPLDKKIDIKKQVLKEKQRKGYTVVEWGANEINE